MFSDKRENAREWVRKRRKGKEMREYKTQDYHIARRLESRKARRDENVTKRKMEKIRGEKKKKFKKARQMINIRGKSAKGNGNCLHMLGLRPNV